MAKRKGDNWQPLTIPLGGRGAKPGAHSLSGGGNASQEAAHVIRAENFLMHREGSLEPRPGITQVSTDFWELTSIGGTSGAISSTLQYSPRALGTAVAGRAEAPALLCDGRAFVRNSRNTSDSTATWYDAGAFNSVSVEKLYQIPYNGAATVAVQAAVARNSRITSGMFTSGASTPTAAFLTPQGVGTAIATGATVLNPVACWLAAPAVLYLDGAGNLKVQAFHNAGGVLSAPSTYTLATDARSTVGDDQLIWGVWDAATEYLYVIYAIAGSTTNCKILKVTPFGTVDATFASFAAVATGAIQSVCIAEVGGKLVTAVSNTGGTDRVISKVISTALVDQSIDLTLSPGITSSGIGQVVVGPAADNSLAAIAWCDLQSTGSSVEWTLRSTSAATNSKGRKIWGYQSVGTNYRVAFAPFRIPTSGSAYRSFLGVFVGEHQDADGTVVLVDVDVGSSTTTGIPPAGHLGLYSTLGGSAAPGGPLAPRPGQVVNGSISTLLVPEYVSYGDNGGSGWNWAVYEARLDRQIPQAHMGAGLYLGGSVGHILQGGTLTDLGWLQTPTISLTTPSGAGGSLAAGDYTVQCVYGYMAPDGTIHRSAASSPVTTTAALNDSIDVKVDQPMFAQKPAAFVEVYCTAVNPSANAPLYLQSRTDLTYGAAYLTPQIDAVSTTGEILGELGTVLPGYPPARGCQGGLAWHQGRLWAASDRWLQPSLLTVGGQEAPRWNDTLDIQLPDHAGHIVALVSNGSDLYALCTNGVYMTGGYGPDNNNLGQPFPDPIRILDLGIPHARSWALCPAGLVVQTLEGSAHLIRGQQAICISDDVDTDDLGTNALQSGPLLTAGRYARLLHIPDYSSVVFVQGEETNSRSAVWWNYTNQQWSSWVLTRSNHLHDMTRCAVGGADFDLFAIAKSTGGATTYLCSFGVANGGAVSYTDAWQDFDPLSPTFRWSGRLRSTPGRGAGWSRIKRIKVLGRQIDSTATTLSASVYWDDMTSGSQSFGIAVTRGAATTWPTGRLLAEMSLQRQKCSSLYLDMTLNAPTALTELELDVMPEAGTAPSAQRA